jgi:molybdopterin-containing oxidoreductase family iron-sulfur binding subunit
MDKNLNDQRLDLQAIREKLAGKTGKHYWQTLEEVADTPQFQTFLDDEFPNRSTLNQINRRDLLKFMGASMALAGLTGCRGVFLPEDKLVPYVKQPEEMVPGEPLYFATTTTHGGYGTGVLIEQREGRPINIQGNPDHPASLGSLDIYSQSEILSMYDPDRPTAPTYQGDLSTWPAFQDAIDSVLQKSPTGAGISILTGTITSPTFADLMAKFLAKHPSAKWHSYEACGRGNAHLGAAMAFGTPYNTIYNFRDAKVVVSLDCDFLNPSENPGSLVYAREFANARRVMGATGTMNRLYSVDSCLGLVAVMADHRWGVKASQVQGIADAIAAGVGVPGTTGGSVASQVQPAINAIVADLKANAGASIVVAGIHQPPAVHALAQAINVALGNNGKTVLHTAPIEASATARSINELVRDMESGAVKTVILIDSNPVYNAPADLQFAEALKKVPLKIQLGGNEDETSELMDWHLPLSHTLESWGDARAFDGTASLQQPLIAPLNDTRSPIEFLAMLIDKKPSGYDLLRGYWNGKLHGDFEKSWRKALNDGVVAGTAFPLATVSTGASSSFGPLPQVPDMEVVFRADPCIFDGRYANNGWLQELPKPITKITWDNVFIVSPATAIALNVVSDDMVRVEVNGVNLEGPVFVQPGHPGNTITVWLGFGRTQGGAVATVNSELEGGGFNAYVARTSQNPTFASGVVTTIGGQRATASTQGHSPLNGDRIIDDRDVIRDLNLADFLNLHGKGVKAEEDAETKEELQEDNLYPEEIFQWDGPQWGMTIDMNTCIGCNACVIACVAENNIPVVGKEQVSRHREMHWLRIDRYYSGTDDNPQVTWQPVACVHCEKAPCEPVCPVAATVHSHEGLNQMIYNRCVGTRYCSNNCPYKVRRFNYLNYSDNQPNFSDRVGEGVFNQSTITGPLHTPRKNGIALLTMMNNPDVTVRGRGVMEKCTYCVQRINYARIEAKKADRPIKDGEIVTACQQACPTQTIVFGNIADKSSAVSRIRKDPRSYLLLEELQTRPRTSHLAKLRNPNPDIKTPEPEAKA